ncbi:hypothetical protein N7485_005194 [Penicillium canescens]|nr:hypothetical protein N7485_005194 [Penicillium canescens]
MSALVHDSPDRAVTAIEPLTGSDNFATWKRLMTSYLKAGQVWDVVPFIKSLISKRAVSLVYVVPQWRCQTLHTQDRRTTGNMVSDGIITIVAVFICNSYTVPLSWNSNYSRW